jgi:hypothetical protein
MPNQQHSKDENISDTHGNTRMGDVQNTRVPDNGQMSQEKIMMDKAVHIYTDGSS